MLAAAKPETLAERLLPRPEPSRQRVVDDHHVPPAILVRLTYHRNTQ